MLYSDIIDIVNIIIIFTTSKHIVVLNVTGLKSSTEAGFTRHRSSDPIQFSASQVVQFGSGTWTCLQGKKKRMKLQIPDSGLLHT